MSKNFCGSSPSFCASASVSHVATIEAPRSMLLQIFAPCPAPASPAWITALPILARLGWLRAKPSQVPPPMQVRVPAMAAALPPQHGRDGLGEGKLGERRDETC